MTEDQLKAKRSLMARLRRYLFTGLVIWIPLGVTIFIIQLFVGYMDRLVTVFPSMRREGAERENHLWTDDFDLADQIRAARRNLFRPRIPVAGRTMLEDVADEHVFALEIDRRENLGEQLARGADERTAGFVFGGARRLADAHQLCVGIALAGHGVDGRAVERAARARRDVRGDLFERIEVRHRAAEQLTGG